MRGPCAQAILAPDRTRRATEREAAVLKDKVPGNVFLGDGQSWPGRARWRSGLQTKSRPQIPCFLRCRKLKTFNHSHFLIYKSSKLTALFFTSFLSFIGIVVLKMRRKQLATDPLLGVLLCHPCARPWEQQTSLLPPGVHACREPSWAVCVSHAHLST